MYYLTRQTHLIHIYKKIENRINTLFQIYPVIYPPHFNKSIQNNYILRKTALCWTIFIKPRQFSSKFRTLRSSKIIWDLSGAKRVVSCLAGTKQFSLRGYLSACTGVCLATISLSYNVSESPNIGNRYCLLENPRYFAKISG